MTLTCDLRATASRVPSTTMEMDALAVQETPLDSQFNESHHDEHLHDVEELELGNGHSHSHSHGHSHGPTVADGSLAAIPALSMNSSWKHPQLMFQATGESVRDALAAGHRALDLDASDGLTEIGRVLASSVVPRWELFVSVKLKPGAVSEGPESVTAAALGALRDLQLSYLDAILLPPVPGMHIAGYKAIESLYRQGRIRSIGLRDYTVEDYRELEPHVTVKPDIVQLHVSPTLFRKTTIGFFQEKGLIVQAARTNSDSPVVESIAAKLDKSTEQIIGRWCVQHNLVYISESSPIGIWEFELSPEEMEQLDELTTEETIKEWRERYNEGIVKGTALEGKFDAAARKVTED